MSLSDGCCTELHFKSSWLQRGFAATRLHVTHYEPELLCACAVANLPAHTLFFGPSSESSSNVWCWSLHQHFLCEGFPSCWWHTNTCLKWDLPCETVRQGQTIQLCKRNETECYQMRDRCVCKQTRWCWKSAHVWCGWCGGAVWECKEVSGVYWWKDLFSSKSIEENHQQNLTDFFPLW